MYWCPHGRASPYLADHQSFSGATCQAIGSRAFPVAGPKTWNALPEDVTSSQSEVFYGHHHLILTASRLLAYVRFCRMVYDMTYDMIWDHLIPASDAAPSRMYCLATAARVTDRWTDGCVQHDCLKSFLRHMISDWFNSEPLSTAKWHMQHYNDYTYWTYVIHMYTVQYWNR